MLVQDIVRVYQAKTDEELLHLATTPEHLTPEARLALESELSRRRVNVAEFSKALQPERGITEQTGITENALERASQGVGEFVSEILRSYHNHFWLFLQIIFPAVVMGTIAVIVSRNESREIARHLPRGYGFVGHQSEILQIWLSNLTGYFASWMAFALAFGAICVAVREIESGIIPSCADCFGAVRKRFGAFFRLSMLLFFLVLVALAASGLLSLGIMWVLHQSHFALNRLAIWFVSFVSVGLALLVFSRFSLAIPAVVLDDCGVAPAMFRSDELTEGEWLTLAAILAKSIIGGYVAAMCPFWLASWIIPASVRPSWFPWLLTFFSVIGVAVVEPTMFIGFALLYLRKSQSSASSKAFVRQFA